MLCNQITDLYKNGQEYYRNGMDRLGKTASNWKILRNDVSFSKKIGIAAKGSLEFMNALRGTSQLLKLTHVLNAFFLSDITGSINDGIGYMKPVNVSTVHAPALVNKIYKAVPKNLRTANLKNRLENQLNGFFKELTDIGKGELFGGKNSQEFLELFQGYIVENGREEMLGGIKLADVIDEVPLIKVRWADWLTTKVFQTVGIMTIVSYFRDWDFIDTASWASRIGQVQGFSWVGNLDFNTVFMGVLFSGFAFAVAAAARKIYTSSAGASAKARAPYELVSSFAEAVYFKIQFLNNLNVVKASPMLSALGLFAAKSIGAFCIVEKPKDDRFDIPLSEVAQPTAADKLIAKVGKVFSPITNQPAFVFVAQKINRLITNIFELIHDFMNLEKDGYDKLIKVLAPGLKLLDMGLQAAELTTSSIFGKCTKSLDEFKELIYATKIFTIFPNYITKNGNEKNYHFTTPFYVYDQKLDSYKFQPLNGVCQTLLDIGVIGDFFKFLRKYEIYRSENLVSVGNAIAESRISMFGRSAQIKDIPGLREINRSLKNLTTIPYAFIKGAEQVWKRDFYERNALNRQEFSFMKLATFGGHIGKITICMGGVDDSFTSQLICFLTGASGLTYSIRQYRLRKKIRLRSAVARAA